MVPNTAVALPEISPDGTTWTIRIKPGIYFADDSVFKGRKRELVAQDYVFAWKRALDPRVRGPAFGLFDRRFVGSESVQAKAQQSGKLDYDLPIEGLQAIDRYTLRLKLDFADTEFLSNLTLPETAAVAREVIEAYGDASTRAMANPVGTGPYRLKEWRRGQKIVLDANADFREVRYPESSDPADAAKNLRLLWVSCGDRDSLMRISRGFHEALDQKKVPHVWHVDSGGHTWPVWKNDLYLFAPMLFREKK